MSHKAEIKAEDIVGGVFTPVGPTGSIGETGTQGDTGDTGPTGASGAQMANDRRGSQDSSNITGGAGAFFINYNSAGAVADNPPFAAITGGYTVTTSGLYRITISGTLYNTTSLEATVVELQIRMRNDGATMVGGIMEFTLSGDDEDDFGNARSFCRTIFAQLTADDDITIVVDGLSGAGEGRIHTGQLLSMVRIRD